LGSTIVVVVNKVKSYRCIIKMPITPFFLVKVLPKSLHFVVLIATLKENH
jgi:riboflavin transporter FmnP